MALDARSFTPLCLWCEHFYLSVGEQGYSDLTPGSDFYMDCQKSHWKYELHNSEEHYRECLLAAIGCADYRVKASLVNIEPLPQRRRLR